MNMKRWYFLPALIFFSGLYIESTAQFYIGSTEVDTLSVVTNLDTPWEILWGPDDHIWFTERYGRISRLDPESGQQSVLLTIEDVHEVAESGLLGMVLHPDFTNQPYVYLVYTYEGPGGIEERLVRYTYANETLVSPLTLIEGIRGASTHDGSRLVIDSNLKLFMTTGDANDKTLPQDLSSLSGKVLRLNLDGTVPDDNPIAGSYIWSWGHRNAQGLVIAPSGIMYSSEHGPSSDDELNIIEKGRNYGWPTVQGYCNTSTEVAFCQDSNVVEPIAAWTPTLAVAGTDFYSQGPITEWHNSLLVTSLKASEMTVLKLSEDGRSVDLEESNFKNWFGRLRDVCVSPDGRVFLAVSNRDGRGNVRAGDDRIVEIKAVNVENYCYDERDVFICEGSSYNFYGQSISEPGTYVDTLVQQGDCDSIISLHLYHYAHEDMGLEDTVFLALNETVTLSANQGFTSYSWNGAPASQNHSVVVNASELGEGIHDYILEVVTSFACIQKDTVVLVVSVTSDVDRLEDPAFLVYPNPVHGQEVHIEYSVNEEAVLILYDPLGRELKRQVMYPGETRKSITLPEEAGLYLLVLSNGKSSSHVKLLKQ